MNKFDFFFAHGQTTATPASKTLAMPGNCSDKTSSEKMKKRPSKASFIMPLLALMLLLNTGKSFGQVCLPITIVNNTASTHYYCYILDYCNDTFPCAPGAVPSAPLDIAPMGGSQVINQPIYSCSANCYVAIWFTDVHGFLPTGTNCIVLTESSTCTMSTWTVYSDCSGSNPATLSFDCTTNTWTIN